MATGDEYVMVDGRKFLSREAVEELTAFMNGPDNRVLCRMINYFSYGSRYLTPRELKKFWDSLTEVEKTYWRTAIWHVKFE
jgi:hypothetical protein